MMLLVQSNFWPEGSPRETQGGIRLHGPGKQNASFPEFGGHTRIRMALSCGSAETAFSDKITFSNFGFEFEPFGNK